MNSAKRCELTFEVVCELNRAYLLRSGSPAQALQLAELSLEWLGCWTGRLIEPRALLEKAATAEGNHHDQWSRIAARIREVADFREMKLGDLTHQASLGEGDIVAKTIEAGVYPFMLVDVIRSARALNFNPDYLLGLTPVSFPVFDVLDPPGDVDVSDVIQSAKGGGR